MPRQPRPQLATQQRELKARVAPNALTPNELKMLEILSQCRPEQRPGLIKEYDQQKLAKRCGLLPTATPHSLSAQAAPTANMAGLLPTPPKSTGFKTPSPPSTKTPQMSQSPMQQMPPGSRARHAAMMQPNQQSLPYYNNPNYIQPPATPNARSMSPRLPWAGQHLQHNGPTLMAPYNQQIYVMEPVGSPSAQYPVQTPKYRSSTPMPTPGYQAHMGNIVGGGVVQHTVPPPKYGTPMPTPGYQPHMADIVGGRAVQHTMQLPDYGTPRPMKRSHSDMNEYAPSAKRARVAQSLALPSPPPQRGYPGPRERQSQTIPARACGMNNPNMMPSTPGYMPYRQGLRPNTPVPSYVLQQNGIQMPDHMALPYGVSMQNDPEIQSDFPYFSNMAILDDTLPVSAGVTQAELLAQSNVTTVDARAMEKNPVMQANPEMQDNFTVFSNMAIPGETLSVSYGRTQTEPLAGSNVPAVQARAMETDPVMQDTFTVFSNMATPAEIPPVPNGKTQAKPLPVSSVTAIQDRAMEKSCKAHRSSQKRRKGSTQPPAARIDNASAQVQPANSKKNIPSGIQSSSAISPPVPPEQTNGGASSTQTRPSIASAINQGMERAQKALSDDIVKAMLEEHNRNTPWKAGEHGRATGDDGYVPADQVMSSALRY